MSRSPSPPKRPRTRYETLQIPAPASSGWRSKAHELIFESETTAGRVFDVTLWICILASVTAVLLESVTSIRLAYGPILRTVEWGFTVLFTIEYALRLAAVGRPWRYATSFFGIVDLLAILPTYLSLVVTGTQSLLVIRTLRLLRIFRVFKLARFVGAERLLRSAVRASARKIIVFLGAVLTLVLIIGAMMYLIEGEENGFTNIPQSIYWAIVTMTTVGYGDIAPQTVVGKLFASMVMIIGYGIIAVPTGIVTVELAAAQNKEVSTEFCPECASEGHDVDAKHCKYCGARL